MVQRAHASCFTSVQVFSARIKQDLTIVLYVDVSLTLGSSQLSVPPETAADTRATLSVLISSDGLNLQRLVFTSDLKQKRNKTKRDSSKMWLSLCLVQHWSIGAHDSLQKHIPFESLCQHSSPGYN